ncbi:MAG: FtsH protease activity modulator HflK [Planctomycetes bacterium]|nr:FtsH protease activity modulator HflK [Planctomycetota bacterium]
MMARRGQRTAIAAGGGALLLAVLAAGIYSSTWVVQQDEQGVVLTCGRVSRVAQAGINFTLPWPLETMERVSITQVRPMPVGFKMQDKVRNIPPADVEVQWLSGDTNIVELQATVYYTVRDPVEYLFGMSDSADGASRDYVVRRVSEAVLSGLIATMAIDDVLTTGKASLSLETIGPLQDELDALATGLRVNAINVVEVGPPQDVIGAFNDVSTAKQDKARQTEEAQGYALRIKPRARATVNTLEQGARAYGSELLNRAQGAAASFIKLAEEVKKDPGLARRRLWLDAVERILARGRTIVVQPAAGGERVAVYLEAGEKKKEPAGQEDGGEEGRR